MRGLDDPVVVARRPIGPPPLALRLAAVLAVPLLLYALVMTGQKAVENYQLNQQADSLRAQIAGLRAQNVQLQQQIEQARTDAAIETIAREQLGLIKPGDHPLVLISDGSSGTSTVSTAPVAEPTSAPEPTWRQWWDYVVG
ncbi:MAG: septum formation initiator family protein [Chloroflexi bacterium]|nr:septum formation initiator family protein [Chloroflexota bacterium]MBV9597108.1 septum formation initiator family protein [Chloroflexota bacterium]